ncbi:MAG: RNase P modulator RnpM [Lachnospira sp.]
MKNKKDLVRILKAEDNTISIDTTGKKNGRGAYICPDMECLKKAIAHKGLERSFKMAIEPAVYENIKKEMEIIGKESLK